MTNQQVDDEFDVLIIGGGAAGLMASVLLSRKSPNLKIALLDGAKRLGAKILISGGGRCNVTNTTVTAKDFHGGSRNVIKRVLKEFSAKKTACFFNELGVPLHEEEHGKLFPDSNKARTVLEALIDSATSNGVHILTDQKVIAVGKKSEIFEVQTQHKKFSSPMVILATGGQSIPKTGSDGFGYQLAKKLSHSVTPLFPALVPLVLSGEIHQPLSGISVETELTLNSKQAKPLKVTGSLLWTHFGVSGPVVLNVSRHWHAAKLNNLAPLLSANFLPGVKPLQLEEIILSESQKNSNGTLRKFLAQQFPNRFVEALLVVAQIPAEMTFSQFPKEQRKRLVKLITEFQFSVNDSRGFGFAEATAGGVPLSEVNPSTMESRICPGLHFVGEILDVDGKLGGFNFQWAWSSAAVAASGISKSVHS